MKTSIMKAAARPLRKLDAEPCVSIRMNGFDMTNFRKKKN